MAKVVAIVGAVGLGCVVALALAPRPPDSWYQEMRDRKDIDGCWSEWPRPSSHEERAILFGMCTGLEERYHKEHGKWYMRKGRRV